MAPVQKNSNDHVDSEFIYFKELSPEEQKNMALQVRYDIMCLNTKHT